MCCNCNNKSCCKYICKGIIIWVVAFMVASLFVAFNMANTAVSQIVTSLAAIVAAYMLAKKTGITNKMEMLKYSFVWVLVILILDYFVTTKFTGMEFFSDWKTWLAYALILLVPLLAVKSAPKSVQ